MSIQLRRFAALLCTAGIISVPSIVLAASDDASAKAEDTKALRSEVAELRHELSSIKSQIKHRHVKHGSKVKRLAPIDAEQAVSTTGSTVPAILPFDPDVPGRSFVSIGPYVGLPFNYAGTNLVVNSPSVNTDVQLLSTRKKIISHLNDTVGNLSADPNPHLLLSGVVEGQAVYEKLDNQSSSDINLTNVSIDAILFGPSNWLLGFVELSYNGNPTPAGTFRVSNSGMYVNKAFITIGNFNESPFYGSVGQFYVPFGTYSSAMVSDPFTKLLARTKARAALVGFQQQDENSAFYGSLYAFRGDTDPHNNRINNGGVNVGYKFNAGTLSGNVGGGVIANLADSVGMQSSGFDDSTQTEMLQNRVPAYNLRGSFSFGKNIDIIGEVVSATRSFSMQDMSFNSHGAKPWAADLQALYSFPILDCKPSSIGVNIERTGQALALGLPETRYSAVFNTSLLKHTLQSLEFRRDHFYGSSKVATVAGNSVASGRGIYDNVLTAQFDYYF